jgi:hypothetical protein
VTTRKARQVVCDVCSDLVTEIAHSDLDTVEATAAWAREQHMASTHAEEDEPRSPSVSSSGSTEAAGGA